MRKVPAHFFCVLINCKFKWTIQKTEKDRELNLAIFLFLPVATSPHPPRNEVYFPVWPKWARQAWEGRPNLSELNLTQPGQTCNWRQQSNWVVPPWNSKPWWLGNLALIFFYLFFFENWKMQVRHLKGELLTREKEIKENLEDMKETKIVLGKMKVEFS